MNPRILNRMMPNTSYTNVLTSLVAPAIFLVFSASTFAASPSLASLNGSYPFQMSNTYEVYWNGNQQCTYGGVKYTYHGGGQSADTEVSFGALTFDGKGNVSADYTSEGTFNQPASDDTVAITCPKSPSDNPITNNGHLVEDPPSTGTQTGTYTVAANGTGTITFKGQSTVFLLNLAEFNSAGVSDTVFLRIQFSSTNVGTGLAVHK